MTLPTRITATDPEARSADPIAGNITRLKALFPEAVTEGKIDFEVLKQLLGGAVDEREEKYGLTWHGKRQARQLALTPSLGTLRPCPEESVDWETTKNLMIEGDNLEVLKLLQKSYAGKVKMIYLDPPYNTGHDFVYPDRFTDSLANYFEITNQEINGHKVDCNVESNGRFHTNWLNMMLPRLLLVRSLMRNDGVVFISIDDRELSCLRLVANDIFGEENFVSTISVVNNLKGRNDKRHIAACHEYVVIYAGQDFCSYGLPLTDEQRSAFKHKDEKGYSYALRDLRKRGGPDRREDRPNMYFPVYWDEESGRLSMDRMAQSDIEIFPMRGDGSEGRWRWGAEKVRKHIAWLHPKRSGRNGRLDVEHRVYLDPSMSVEVEREEDEDDNEDGVIERTSKPKSFWLGGEFSTDSAKRSMKELLPGDVFDFPKSIDFLRTCILMSTRGDDIILDGFAGSGSTAQAVMRQNAIDRQSRRIISVQLPEPLAPSDKDRAAAAAFCANLGRPKNIAELTKERLRRAGAKIKADNPDFTGDLGFRVFKLDASNLRTWEPRRDDLAGSIQQHIDHLRPGRTPEDLLFEILLKYGLDLSSPITVATVGGFPVHRLGGGVLTVCLADGITADRVEALGRGLLADLADQGVDLADARLVFKDHGFADDVAKANLTALLTQGGIRLDHLRTL